MEYLNQISEVAFVYGMIYYFIVLLSSIYVLTRYGFNKYVLLVLILFWEGWFSYISKISFFPFELYRIIVVVYSMYLFFPKIFLNKRKSDNLINISFILFSFSFLISNISESNSLFTVLSQYGFKYGLPYLFYHGIKDIQINYTKAKKMANLLILVLLIQVVLSMFKVLLVGFIEAIVGSLSSKGAGVAVVIPILGFLLYWLDHNGHFTKKEWLISISFIFIAVASIKRAPVLLFPVVVLYMVSLTKKRIRLGVILRFIPFAILLLYIGVRTNPTLNPNKSMWGKFDLKYVVDYAIQYNFGDDDILPNDNETYGRGGSLLILFSPNKLNLNHNFQILFGHGIVDMALQNYGRFVGGESYGIDHKGLICQAIKITYSLGYLGLAFYLLFALSLIRCINSKRFKFLIIGFFFWEFFFYEGVLLSSNSVAFLLIFIILYSNFIFHTNKNRSSLKILYVPNKVESSNPASPI